MALYPHKWKFKPGAPARWESADNFADEWGEYFEACHKAKLIPTFGGAAIWFALRQEALKGYADRDEYKEVYQAAIEYMEAMVVDRLFRPGSPVGAIFYLCNRYGHRWSNRHQQEASQPAGGSGSGTSNSIIVIGYNEKFGPPRSPDQAAPEPAPEDGETDA